MLGEGVEGAEWCSERSVKRAKMDDVLNGSQNRLACEATTHWFAPHRVLLVLEYVFVERRACVVAVSGSMGVCPRQSEWVWLWAGHPF